MRLACWCYQFFAFISFFFWGGGVGIGGYVLPVNIFFIHLKVNLSKRECTFYASCAYLVVKIMPSLALSSIMTIFNNNYDLL